jgi:hypothetical protein
LPGTRVSVKERTATTRHYAGNDPSHNTRPGKFHGSPKPWKIVFGKKEAKNGMNSLRQYPFHYIAELMTDGGRNDKLLPVTLTKY